jgi:hypothetical protein
MRRVLVREAAAQSAAPVGLGEDLEDGDAGRHHSRAVHAERRALTTPATTSWVFITTSDEEPSSLIIRLASERDSHISVCIYDSPAASNYVVISGTATCHNQALGRIGLIINS